MTDKRLIETAFPLEHVSLDAVHEKRRLLAACRAALIATLLPDVGGARERQAVYRRMAGTVVETVEDERADGRTVVRWTAEVCDHLLAAAGVPARGTAVTALRHETCHYQRGPTG